MLVNTLAQLWTVSFAQVFVTVFMYRASMQAWTCICEFSLWWISLWNFALLMRCRWQERLCLSGWRHSLKIQLKGWKILDLYSPDQEVWVQCWFPFKFKESVVLLFYAFEQNWKSVISLSMELHSFTTLLFWVLYILTVFVLHSQRGVSCK